MPWIGGFSVMKKAPVNKIIWFSNVDGPGNRTAVFFQGCPFNCLFCHNPETIHLCSSCGACVPGCPAGALSVIDGQVAWNKDRCVSCDACIKACPHTASPRVRWMTVDEVFAEISRALPYIDGVTVSGGECTLYTDFLLDLFPLIRAEGKTCLLDSNGSFDFEIHPEILSCSDGVMLDVKAVSPAWSRQLISFPPDLVLKNLDYLLSAGKLQEVRTVVFPDRPAENGETVRYVAGRIGNACDYKIIRYRPFGVREENLPVVGDRITEEEEAERLAALARGLGAARAFVV